MKLTNDVKKQVINSILKNASRHERRNELRAAEGRLARELLNCVLSGIGTKKVQDNIDLLLSATKELESLGMLKAQKSHEILNLKPAITVRTQKATARFRFYSKDGKSLENLAVPKGAFFTVDSTFHARIARHQKEVEAFIKLQNSAMRIVIGYLDNTPSVEDVLTRWPELADLFPKNCRVLKTAAEPDTKTVNDILGIGTQ